jgi:hypothetical protein
MRTRPIRAHPKPIHQKGPRKYNQRRRKAEMFIASYTLIIADRILASLELSEIIARRGTNRPVWTAFEPVKNKLAKELGPVPI